MCDVGVTIIPPFVVKIVLRGRDLSGCRAVVGAGLVAHGASSPYSPQSTVTLPRTRSFIHGYPPGDASHASSRRVIRRRKRKSESSSTYKQSNTTRYV